MGWLRFLCLILFIVFLNFLVDIDTLIRDGMAEIPAFCGMKFSSPDISIFSSVYGKYRKEFKVFAGLNENVLPSFAGFGCDGNIVSITNFPWVNNLYKDLCNKRSTLTVQDVWKANEVFQDAFKLCSANGC